MKKYYTYDIINIKYDTPEIIVQHIQNAFEKYGKDNVSFEVGWEDDEDIPTAYLQCKREMNDKEREHQIALDTQQEMQAEAYQKKQYELLKKKFEGK